MTAPSTAGIGKLGPGRLTIGATGTEIDVSCLVNGARITASKDVSDPTQKLCGTWRLGSISYTYELTGNVDVDAGNAAGLFALSVQSPGTEQPFTFTPSTAVGTSAAGRLVIDPLDFGADAFGDDLTSDFTYSLVGDPVYTFGGGDMPPAGPDKAHVKAGDTFPADAAITASDSTNAAKLTGLGYTADPSTAWTSGQRVTVGTYAFSWDGTTWSAGAAS